MPDLNVTFLHPTHGGTLGVAMDDEMTAREAIQELIADGFIPASPEGYRLARKGESEMRDDQTFREAGVRNDNVLRVLPATLAGGLAAL